MLRRLVTGALAAAALTVPAYAQDAYVIGVTGALTGPPAGTNAPPIEGLRLYVDRLNAGGGVNGKKIRLIVLDDGAEPSKAAANAGGSSPRTTSACSYSRASRPPTRRSSRRPSEPTCR